MTLPDAINGGFEIGGAAAQLLSIRALMRSRHLEGVSWTATAFFSGWGMWNLFYYPHLGQTLSFLGGAALVCVNLTWVALALRYSRRRT